MKCFECGNEDPNVGDGGQMCDECLVAKFGRCKCGAALGFTGECVATLKGGCPCDD